MHQRVKDIMVDAGKKTKSTYLNHFARNASDETIKYANFGRREICEKELEF